MITRIVKRPIRMTARGSEVYYIYIPRELRNRFASGAVIYYDEDTGIMLVTDTDENIVERLSRFVAEMGLR